MFTNTRRTLLLLALASAVTATGSVKGFADNPVTAYITVRCTATISVELFSRTGGLYNKTTYYAFGDMAAASTATSVNPIGVRNNSIGAITRWELDVLEPGGFVDVNTRWTLGSTPGLNRATLYAKFTSSNAYTNDVFDMVNDTVTTTSQGAKTYASGKFYYQNTQYVEPTFSYDCSRVLPVSYDPSAEGKAERQLWVKLLTPTAVETANYETLIQLRITAK